MVGWGGRRRSSMLIMNMEEMGVQKEFLCTAPPINNMPLSIHI